MSNRKRTKYDRIIDCWRYAQLAIASSDSKYRQKAMELVDTILTNLQGSGHGLRKSELATSGIKTLHDFITGQLVNLEPDKGTPLNQAIQDIRTYFYLQFPDFEEKMQLKREKIITQGKIRTEEEFYLVQDMIYELEGPRDNEDLLNKLYAMADNFEGE